MNLSRLLLCFAAIFFLEQQFDCRVLSSESAAAAKRAEWKAQIENSRQRVEELRKSGILMDEQLGAADISDIPSETKEEWLSKVEASKDRVTSLRERMENGEHLFLDIDNDVDIFPTGSIKDKLGPPQR